MSPADLSSTATFPRDATPPGTGGVLSQLTARLRPLAAELSKFMVVGGAATALDIALANLLHFAGGLGPTLAKAIATVVATVASYYANRMWSFAHRVDDGARQSRDITVYAIVNAVGLVITLVPVDIGAYVLHERSVWSFNVASVLGSVVATAFRFWAYRRWVFTREAAERNALV